MFAWTEISKDLLIKHLKLKLQGFNVIVDTDRQQNIKLTTFYLLF